MFICIFCGQGIIVFSIPLIYSHICDKRLSARRNKCFLGGTLTQSILTSGLEIEYLLEQYKALNASIKDTSLKQNLEVKLKLLLLILLFKFYINIYLA
jgi:hypothetical protein